MDCFFPKTLPVVVQELPSTNLFLESNQPSELKHLESEPTANPQLLQGSSSAVQQRIHVCPQGCRDSARPFPKDKPGSQAKAAMSVRQGLRLCSVNVGEHRTLWVLKMMEPPLIRCFSFQIPTEPAPSGS